MNNYLDEPIMVTFKWQTLKWTQTLKVLQNFSHLLNSRHTYHKPSLCNWFGPVNSESMKARNYGNGWGLPAMYSSYSVVLIRKGHRKGDSTRIVIS